MSKNKEIHHRKELRDTIGNNQIGPGKTQLTADITYPIIEEVPGVRLSNLIKRRYGCSHCEWRGTSLCHFPTKIIRKRRVTHTNGICQERVNYLASFYRGEKAIPTLVEWENDYRMGIASMQLNEDFNDFKKAELSVKKLEKEDPENKNEWKKREHYRIQKREEWLDLWKSITERDDKHIARHTPKQVEITQKKKISLNEIHKIMKTKIVDVEVTDVEDKDE